MPIYTYQCRACDNVTEKRQSFSDDPLTICEACGGELRKLLHPVGIVFKGSGFYNTDYRGNGAAKSKAESTKTETDGAAASSDGATSSKTPAKTDAGAKSEGGAKAEGGSSAPAKAESAAAAKAD